MCRPTEVTLQDCRSQENIKAVAFISPPDRLIQSGLPPTERQAPISDPLSASLGSTCNLTLMTIPMQYVLKHLRARGSVCHG